MVQVRSLCFSLPKLSRWGHGDSCWRAGKTQQWLYPSGWIGEEGGSRGWQGARSWRRLLGHNMSRMPTGEVCLGFTEVFAVPCSQEQHFHTHTRLTLQFWIRNTARNIRLHLCGSTNGNLILISPLLK